MIRSFAELSPQEVLALAIQVEHNNTHRLQTLADMFTDYNEDVHATFLQMRDEEIEHAAMLEEVWKRRYGDDPKPEVSEIEVREVVECVDLEDGEHLVFDDLDADDALQAVHRAEVAAEAFYRGAAAATDDADLKSLYTELADLELGHIAHVEGRQEVEAGDGEQDG